MTNSIGYGLLAFAVSSSLALANGGGGGEGKPNPFQDNMPGWTSKAGSGITYDGGEAFRLRIRNQLQVHWVFMNMEDAPDVVSFNIRRARTALTGHVFKPQIMYRLQLEAVDDGVGTNGALKDGWVQWNFMDSDEGELGVRVGQSKTQFGLMSTGGSTGLFFVERASASRAFTDVRSRGAWLHGTHAENKLRWSAGAQNGDPAGGASTAGITDRGEEAPNTDNELSYTASANFDPMGDFFDGKGRESHQEGDFRTDDRPLRGTIGAGIFFGNGTNAVTGTDVETTALNLNTAWKVNSIHLQGEFFLRKDDLQGGAADEEESHGWYAQGMYVLPRSGDSATQWGVGVRLNMIETDSGDNATVNFLNGAQGIFAAEGEVMEITGVLDAFYYGHACKTQLEYTFQDVDPDGASSQTNHIFRIAFQLLF